jgi:serine/threonine protein kinase
VLAKIGPFDVHELVGRGGMGSVYRAVDPVIGRPVAIKIIRLIGYNDGEEASFLRDRLFKEARAAGRLSHPGIVTIYQVGVEEDLAYIAMEYVDGPTLESCMASAGPLDPDLLSRALCGTAAALDYAHERAVIHRDIKPSNIMFTTGGVAKVTDFGIAKTMLGHTTTRTGALLGTPYYMSPEQVGGMNLDGRSDQFALAVIAYQMLTRRRPFQADQVTSICYQIAHVEPACPADLNPALNFGVSGVLSRGLAKNPADRFPTCMEFAGSLIQEYARALRREHEPATSVAESISVEPPAEGTPPPAEVQKRTATLVRAWVPWAVVFVCACAVAGLLALSLSREAAQLPYIDASHERTLEESTEPPVRVSPANELRESTTWRASTHAAALPQQQNAQAVPRQTAPILGRAVDELKGTREPIILPRGRVVWTGSAGAGTLVTIEHGHASVGTVEGYLPGTPVDVQVFPASTSSEGLTVFTVDMRYATPAKEWTSAGPATFVWDPRHSTDLFVWELPSPANGWHKIVLRINTPEVTGCIVQWRAKTGLMP